MTIRKFGFEELNFAVTVKGGREPNQGPGDARRKPDIEDTSPDGVRKTITTRRNLNANAGSMISLSRLTGVALSGLFVLVNVGCEPDAWRLRK